MRILFANDFPHLPENTGGVEVNTHELSLALAGAGHQVTVLTALLGRGLTGAIARVKLRSRRGQGFAIDRGLGYPVLRAWFPEESLGAAMDWFKPDAVIVQSWRFTMVAEALRRGAAALLYSHGVESVIENVDADLAARYVPVANSAFTAGFQGGALGLNFAVLHPMIDAARYRCNGPRTHVLQVGLSEAKGAPVTLAAARLRPDIPFLVVQNWEGLRRRPQAEALLREARTLPNLRVIPPERDARKLYRRTRLLLAPSQWLETWGRVVNEAQINGIPVVASNRGGLPESVGAGGILLDADAPAEVWVQEIGRLWDDPAWYAEMAQRARTRAAAPDIRPDALLQRLLALLQEAVSRRNPGA